jgi:hypothetical protein
MLGGLLYELLTAGHLPYEWALDNVSLLRARLVTDGHVPLAGVAGPGAVGLLGKSVVEAAVIDGVRIPWTVREPGQLLAEAQALITLCCAQDPSARITVAALAQALEAMRGAVTCHLPGAGPGVFTSLHVSHVVFMSTADLISGTVVTSTLSVVMA